MGRAANSLTVGTWRPFSNPAPKTRRGDVWLSARIGLSSFFFLLSSRAEASGHFHFHYEELNTLFPSFPFLLSRRRETVLFIPLLTFRIRLLHQSQRLFIHSFIQSHIRIENLSKKARNETKQNKTCYVYRMDLEGFFKKKKKAQRGWHGSSDQSRYQGSGIRNAPGPCDGLYPNDAPLGIPFFHHQSSSSSNFYLLSTLLTPSIHQHPTQVSQIDR